MFRSRKRRARKSASVAVDPQVLVRALEEIQLNSATGRLTVLTATGGRAHLYVFEGDLYAVDLDGYQPPIDRRLHSGALLDTGRLAELAADQPDSSPASRARLAVERGWVAVEALGSIHQEFVLAAFGSVMQANVVSTSFADGAATGEVCALPVALDVLVEAVAIRQARLGEDWARLLGSTASPDEGSAQECVLRGTNALLPLDCQLPEFAALVSSCDGSTSLAQVAFESGYTLAEAVHLAHALSVRGVVAIVDAPVPSASELLVPEDFARLVIPLGTLAPADSAVPALEMANESEESDEHARAQEELHADESPVPDDGTAQLEALREELLRAQAHVESIRAQLEQMGAVLADA